MWDLDLRIQRENGPGKWISHSPHSAKGYNLEAAHRKQGSDLIRGELHRMLWVLPFEGPGDQTIWAVHNEQSAPFQCS